MNTKKAVLLLLVFWMTIVLPMMAQHQSTNTTSESDNPISLDNPRKTDQLIQVDSIGRLLFGEVLTELVQNTKSLNLYKLSNYLAAAGDTTAQLEHFPILQEASIDEERQKEIGALLTSAKPYMVDKDIKNLCFFLPDMGIELVMENQPVNVLISLDCKMVRFYYPKDSSLVQYLELNTRRSYSGFEHLYDSFFKESIKPRFVSNNENIKPEKNKKEPDITLSNEATPLMYTVKPGEGWSHVALNATKAFGRKITMEEIQEFNNFSTQAVLKIGQKIIIGYIN